MIDVTQHNVLPTNDGETNRKSLVAIYKSLTQHVGGVLYFPAGTYLMAPINRTVLNRIDTRYASIRGDGIKATVIKATESGILFDYDGLDCFDQHFQDICFHGAKKAASAFRLTSGGNHYRATFRDVWFRSCVADGLAIRSTQVIPLNNVVATDCGGWGIRLTGPLSVNGDIDVEFNKLGGILIESDPKSNRVDVGVLLGSIYQEGCNPLMRIDGVSGVRVLSFPSKSKVEFANGASSNTIEGNGVLAEFEDGCVGNVIRGHNCTVTGDKRNTVSSTSDHLFSREPNLGQFGKPIKVLEPVDGQSVHCSTRSDLAQSRGYVKLRLKRVGNCRMGYAIWNYHAHEWWSPRTRVWSPLDQGRSMEVSVPEGRIETLYLPIPEMDTDPNRSDVLVRLFVSGVAGERVEIYQFEMMQLTG